MEIYHHQIYLIGGNKFKIDLIVWKLVFFSQTMCFKKRFKIDLIVWKLYSWVQRVVQQQCLK